MARSPLPSRPMVTVLLCSVLLGMAPPVGTVVVIEEPNAVAGQSVELRCVFESLYFWRYARRERIWTWTHDTDRLMCSTDCPLCGAADPGLTCVTEPLEPPVPRWSAWYTLKLTIANVSLEDAGEYQCRNIDSEDRESSPCRGTLIVYRRPDGESPRCLLARGSAATTHSPGANVTVLCRSSGGVPRAQIAWFVGERLVAGPAVGEIRYTHTMEEAEGANQLTCRLEQVGSPLEPENCSLVLALQPTVAVRPSRLQIASGGNATFACHGRHVSWGPEGYSWVLQPAPGPGPPGRGGVDVARNLTEGNGLTLIGVTSTGGGGGELAVTCRLHGGAVGDPMASATATLLVVDARRPTREESDSRLDDAATVPYVPLASAAGAAVLVAAIVAGLVCLVRRRRRSSAASVQLGMGRVRPPGPPSPPQQDCYQDLSMGAACEAAAQQPAYQGLDLSQGAYANPYAELNTDAARPQSVYEVCSASAPATRTYTSGDPPRAFAKEGAGDNVYVNHSIVKVQTGRGMRPLRK